jgi:hypothetical protein
MKLKRAEFISALENEIFRRQEDAKRRTHEALERHRQAGSDWRDKYSRAWHMFGVAIVKTTEVDGVVTWDMVPEELRNFSHQLEFFTLGDPPDEYVADVRELQELRKLVDISTDEEVSTYALEKMGFRIANIFKKR